MLENTAVKDAVTIAGDVMYKLSMPVRSSAMIAGLVLLFGCSENSNGQSAETQVANQSSVAPAAAKAEDTEQQAKGQFRTIEWTELMPKDDLDAFLNPPESLNDIEDGSPEDQISSQIQSAIDQAGDSRYQQALVSTRVVAEFDGERIRLPGFIVPLEFGEEEQIITKFFLVPYFGACIHVPPPPPNQIIYAEFEQGFKLESLYDPFWLAGTLSTTMTENDIARSAYALKVEQVEPYP